MKQRHLLWVLLCAFSNFYSHAQEPNFVWAGNIGGTGTDIYYDLALSPFGEMTAVGRFNNNAELNPVIGGTGATSNGGNDIFVTQHDPGGMVVWHLAIGGTGSDYANSVATSSTGTAIYVAGLFESTVNFMPGPGSQTLSSNGSADMFVMELDISGQIQWVRSIGGVGTDAASDIAVDNSGNVYVTGSFQGTVDFDPGAGINNASSNGGNDVYVLKLNSSGNFVSVKTIGGTGQDYAGAMDVDNTGNVYLGGRFENTVDLDPGSGTDNVTASGFADMYVLKLDGSGNYAWGHAIGGSNNDHIYDLHVDGNNDILMTGYFSGSVDFDPGAGTDVQTVAANVDIFTWKLDDAGLHQWSVAFTGVGINFGTAITTNVNDEIYVAGRFESIVDFDPGPGSLNFFSNGGADNFLVHLNTDGDLINGEFMGTPSDEQPRAIVVAGSTSDEITMVGNFTGTGDYDPTTGITTLSSFGSNDGYMVQFLNCLPTSISPDAGSLSDLTDECTVFMPTPPSATNDCGDIYYGEPDVAFPITTPGTTTVTWAFDDLRGNVTTQTQDVIIADVTAPVADAASLPDLTDECSVSIPPAPTATDNCAGIITGVPDVSFPITAPGTTVVTWTYDDGVNIATQTQNVVISDVTAPVADAASLPDLTDECSVSIPPAPTATDNCAGALTGVPDVAFPITVQGTTVVTWTYDDGVNITTQTQNVIISDVTAPTPDVTSLSDYTSECIVDTLIPPTATDNCTGAMTGVADVIFPISAAGTTTVTWTYDDGNGNTSTQSQDVIISPVDISVTQTGITLTANATGAYTYQWVDCNNSYAPVAGETNQNFNPTSDGDYAVIIDNGTCSDTSICFTISGVALNEIQKLHLAVYPNPSGGNVFIELPDASSNYDIEVLDSQGRRVLYFDAIKSGQSELCLDLDAGVYFVHVVQINKSQKIIIE